MIRTMQRFLVMGLVATWALACASDDGASASGTEDIVSEALPGDVLDSDGTGEDATEDSIEDAESGETAEVIEGPFYDPWMVVPTELLPAPRDWQYKRGIIHNHSPYSHDACDGEPFSEDGVRNEQCFDDLRYGMCSSRQDFVFLTDHDDFFAHYDYPDVLIYAEGDELIERDGAPSANRVVCDGDDLGHQVIVSAGTESNVMPIGIEHHMGDTLEERMAAYNSRTPEAIKALQDAGALVFLQHTEEWPIDFIVEQDIDGIEIYNLHFNLMDNMAAALPMLGKMANAPETLPAMEVILIALFQENAEDMLRWSHAVAHKPMPGVLATDAHRNVFRDPSPDGERLDSFRRLMHWFSNYLLIPAELEGDAIDDRVLKEAIAKGRLYGGFDYLGVPLGFDFHAESVVDEGSADAPVIYEMGDQTPDEHVTLVVSPPTVWKADPEGPEPLIKTRLLVAAEEGSWEMVAEVTGTGPALRATLDSPGVYRVEVRITPYHLTPWLGTEPEEYVKELPWVYSNAIYVGMGW